MLTSSLDYQFSTPAICEPNHWKAGYFIGAFGIMCISGCTSDTISTTANNSTLFEPKAITQLRAQNGLTITFTLTINGSVVSTHTPGQQQTAVSVTPAMLIRESNTISIEFFANKDNGEIYRLAVAEHIIPQPDEQAIIELTGLRYNYTDSDSDGRFDVHELAAFPVDADNDGTANVYDTDSDGDGTIDGMDTTPYGATTFNADQTDSFTIRYPDGSTGKGLINGFSGSTTETLHLLNTLQYVEFETPALWPSAQWPEINHTRALTSLGIDNTTDGLCSRLTINTNTSSIRSTASQPVLLYFRREGEEAIVTPIEATDIPDLGSFNPSTTTDNNNSLSQHRNDALRLLLVPEGTVGWIEIWSEPFYEGQVCTVNLTTGT